MVQDGPTSSTFDAYFERMVAAMRQQAGQTSNITFNGMTYDQSTAKQEDEPWPDEPSNPYLTSDDEGPDDIPADHPYIMMDEPDTFITDDKDVTAMDEKYIPDQVKDVKRLDEKYFPCQVKDAKKLDDEKYHADQDEDVKTLGDEKYNPDQVKDVMELDETYYPDHVKKDMMELDEKYTPDQVKMDVEFMAKPVEPLQDDSLTQMYMAKPVEPLQNDSLSTRELVPTRSLMAKQPVVPKPFAFSGRAKRELVPAGSFMAKQFVHKPFAFSGKVKRELVPTTSLMAKQPVAPTPFSAFPSKARKTAAKSAARPRPVIRLLPSQEDSGEVSCSS